MRSLWPSSELILSLQSRVGASGHTHEHELIATAEKLRMTVFESNDDLESTETLYRDCCLHIGYRCHGHILFLRNRRPSFLIAEDSRGIGFLRTNGHNMGFPAFTTKRKPAGLRASLASFTNRRKQRVVAVPDMAVPDLVVSRLKLEAANHFRNFIGIGNQIDELFHCCMKPFIESDIP